MRNIVADADIVLHAPLVEGGIDGDRAFEQFRIRYYDVAAVVGDDGRGPCFDV